MASLSRRWHLDHAPAAARPRRITQQERSLLGWTGSLVIEMLGQIEVASQKAVRPSHRTQPAAGQ